MTLPALLAKALVGEVSLTVPWDKLAELPADVVEAVKSGDPAPLREHVAEIIDDSVAFSGGPLSDLAEHEADAAAEAVLDHVTAVVAERVQGGGVKVGKARELAETLIGSTAEAQAVLAMPPAWRVWHGSMVRAAKAWLAAGE